MTVEQLVSAAKRAYLDMQEGACFEAIEQLARLAATTPPVDTVPGEAVRDVLAELVACKDLKEQRLCGITC